MWTKQNLVLPKKNMYLPEIDSSHVLYNIVYYRNKKLMLYLLISWLVSVVISEIIMLNSKIFNKSR